MPQGQGTGNTIDQAIWLAVTQQSGDNMLYMEVFGRSTSLIANVEEAIWESGGFKEFLSSAETMDLVSDDVADTLISGTGARIVLIDGLDNNYNLITEAVGLLGTAPTATEQKFLRINRLTVISVGSGNKNAGTITATATSAGSIQSVIPAERSISRCGYFTVPAGYTGLMLNTRYSTYRADAGNAVKGAEIDFHVARQDPVTGNLVEYQTAQAGIRNSGTGLAVADSPIPLVMKPKTDMFFAATAETNSTRVSVEYSVLLLKGGHTDLVTQITHI